MRRISLALALVGAVASAGCGAGTKPASDTGGAQGVVGKTFTILVQNGQAMTPTSDPNPSLEIKGGYVLSSPAGIACGVGVPAEYTPSCSFDFPVAQEVTLTAYESGQMDTRYAPARAYHFQNWAGDCSGAVCKLSGNGDKYVVAVFGAERTGHPNWSAGSVHGPQYRAYAAAPTTYEYDCKSCHGDQLQGMGIAISCYGCHHAWDGKLPTPAGYTVPTFTAANPYKVTEFCNGCHNGRAAEIMQTQHWKWKGPTPQLYPLANFALSAADPLTPFNPGTIGKANLINNFCVSVASNEKRCDQCHAGYGGDPDTTTLAADGVTLKYAQKSARGYTATDSSVALANRVDCLICHSGVVQGNMTGSYVKSTGSGNPNPIHAPGFGLPTTTSDMNLAYKAVTRTPTRENCGFCHFNGGGADSVKIMSTALRTPADSVDVHMGPTNNMLCADCHAASNHRIRGASVYTPTNTARAFCEDCHGIAPHAGTTAATLNGHVATVACQTCHIPAFARGKHTKTDWDWSTAGQAATVKKWVNDEGVEVAVGTPGAAEVEVYHYQKGNFTWKKNQKPVYAWSNGKMTHTTTLDKGVMGAMGSTPTNRLNLARPLGSIGDAAAKIMPFKVMNGKQGVYVDDATSGSFVITPKLFGPAPGAFWGVTGPTPPANFSYNPATNEATYATGTFNLDALWTTAFKNGAVVANQFAAGSTMAKSDGTSAGWQWRYTEMYMDLNHEVAPKAQALGCASCHGATPVIDFVALGYACANPANCPR